VIAECFLSDVVAFIALGLSVGFVKKENLSAYRLVPFKSNYMVQYLLFVTS
jgi:hypothetical protein